MQNNHTAATKQEFLEESHQFREDYLRAIQNCDREWLEKDTVVMDSFLKKDSLDIFKRVSGDRLRSLKNFLLSHNTLYSYSAEKGGLNAAKSHYISEKYAIMIEHTDTISDLYHIHTLMVDEYSDPTLRIPRSKNNTIVEKLERFIDINFSEDYTVEEISRKLHVHPSHLMRAFKKENGITISLYRNRKRVAEAKKLLSYSNLTLTDIAIMVGFNNSQYFSKIFKEIAGTSAKTYRLNKSQT
jgi:AraC-like DNA-binding protein